MPDFFFRQIGERDRRFAPDRFDPVEGADGYRGNPIDFLTIERALVGAMQDWIEHDVAPPPSAYPRIDDGSAVTIEGVAFPDIPGVAFPRVIHEAYRADYGPRLLTDGIIDIQEMRFVSAMVESSLCGDIH